MSVGLSVGPSVGLNVGLNVGGIEPGTAVIKLFENDGNVAMLVAGYNADDTRRAAKVVAEFDNYAGDLTGTEVVVTGTSLSDIEVSAPQ